MNAQHTPGPWAANGGSIYAPDGDEEPWVIAEVMDCCGYPDDQSSANTSLIAAAPTLLEAAEALGAMPEGYCFCSENRIGDESKKHEPECADMRAAIAKARGVQP